MNLHLRISGALLVMVSWGCSAAGPPFVTDGDGGSPPVERDATPADEVTLCGMPAPGCPCAEAGATVDCGRVYRISGTYVTCSEGVLTCQDDGGWSACIGDSTYSGH